MRKLGKQDLVMRLRIARKEAKETQYWFELLLSNEKEKKEALNKEAGELRKILSAIINKMEKVAT